MEKLSDRWMCYGGMLAIAGADIDDLKHIQNLIDAEEQGNLVEVVHGEWDAKYDYEDFIEAYCSLCGKKSEYMYKYCPNCGAKMDGNLKES